MASIKRLTNGNYQATVFVGRDSNGKQIRKYLTRDSHREAVAAARELEQEISEGRFTNIKNIRFSKWADEWKDLNENRLSPSTWSSYDRYIEKYFKPTFGNLKLSQINDLIIKKYIAERLKTLSSTTVRKHIYVLSSILEVMKYKNPCKNIEMPKVADYEYHIVTDEEYKKILGFFHGKSYEVIIMLAALCGMRRGEIFALKWEDIDYKNQTIRIQHAICLSKKNGYVEKSTKSKNGIRTIVAPQEIFDLLKLRYKKLLKATHKDEHLKERIFASRPDTFSEWFSQCMKKKLKLNVRFHDLRHYHATWLYKNNIPDLFAAQRLGDNVQTIKKVYQHISSKTEKELNEKILNKMQSLEYRTKNRTKL